MTWPQPFHLQIFNELKKGHQIKADFYCLEYDSTRVWGDIQHLYPIKSISGFTRFGRFKIFLPPIQLFHSLILHRYDCLIIGGWERIYHQFLHLLCYCCGIPVIVGSDLRFGPGGRENRKKTGIKCYLRIRAIKWILKQAKGALGSGKYAVEWFRMMGFKGFLNVGFFGVDSNTFTPQGKKFRKDEFKMLYVGRLVKTKRVGDIIKALPYLQAKGIPITLVVVGDGPARRQIEALAKKIGVQECITFEGALTHSELPELMRNADGFIFPSESEAWGAVLVEAASSGLPLIASDEIGSAKDVLCDGKNGFIFPKGDILKLSLRIEKLWKWKQNGRMSELASPSRSLGKRFSFENCASIYKKAIIFAIN